jgi:hypothetical protein
MEHLHAGKFHTLVARAADRGSEAARKLLTRVSNSEGCSAHARRTGKLLGCNFRRVERIRRIIKARIPEILDAVWNGRMSIDQAYEPVRALKNGGDVTKDKAAAAYRRAVEKAFSPGRLAFFQSLGGDLASHVDRAGELYEQWL